MDQQVEKKTERVAELGRRTREEIVKWNQMTALRFQTGERHQTSPASIRGVARTQVCHHRHGVTPLVSHIVQCFHCRLPMQLSSTHYCLCSVLLSHSLPTIIK